MDEFEVMIIYQSYRTSFHKYYQQSVETESSQREVDNKSDDEGDAATDISGGCDLDKLLPTCRRISLH